MAFLITGLYVWVNIWLGHIPNFSEQQGLQKDVPHLLTSVSILIDGLIDIPHAPPTSWLVKAVTNALLAL